MKGLGRSKRMKNGPIINYDYRIRNLSVPITDPGAAAGYGSVAIMKFPLGNFILLGAVAYIQLSSVSAGIVDAFEGDFGIGRATNANGILDVNEVEIIASTPIGPAINKVTPLTRGVMAQASHGKAINNTANDVNIRLNVAIDDTSLTARSTLIANGNLYLCYCVI